MRQRNHERTIQLLFNRRVIAVLFLSFSSTLPLVLLTGTLQVWYTARESKFNGYGFVIPRLGLYRSLLIFGFTQTVTNLSFMVLALIGKNFTFMITAIFSDYFCGGLATIAFIAFLIALCNQQYSATQYAILSALTAVGRVVIGPLAAYLVKHIGWAPFY